MGHSLRRNKDSQNSELAPNYLEEFTPLSYGIKG